MPNDFFEESLRFLRKATDDQGPATEPNLAAAQTFALLAIMQRLEWIDDALRNTIGGTPL